MPLSGVTPLSLGEYGAAGGATGAGNFAQSLEGLGQTFAQGPLMAARGQYLGAETAQAQTNTAKGRKYLQDAQRIQDLFAPPPPGAAPYTPEEINRRVMEGAGIVAGNETLAAQWPKVMGGIMALGTSGGGQSAPTPGQQAAQSQFAVNTGVQAMGNTATGFQADLANRIRQSQIAIQPGMAGVAEKREEFQQGLHPAVLNGVPGLYSQSQLNAAPPGSVQFFSETAAAENQKFGPVLLPAGGTGYAPPTMPGIRPIPKSDEVLGTIMSGGSWGGQGPFELPGANQPPAQTTGTGAGTTATTPPAATTPGLSRQDITDAAIREKLHMQPVIPAPPNMDPKKQAELDKLLTDTLAREFITPDMQTGLFSVSPRSLQLDPPVRNAIMQRTLELSHTRDARFQNQPENAMLQAIQELKPNLSLDKQHWDATANPTIRWTPPKAQPGTPGNPINPPPLGPQPTQPQRPGPTVANAAQAQPSTPPPPNVPAVYGAAQPVPQMPPGWQPGQSTEPYSAPTPWIYRKAGEVLQNQPAPGATAPTEAEIVQRFGGQPGTQAGPPRPGVGPASATQAQFEAAWRAAHPQAAQQMPPEGTTAVTGTGKQIVVRNGQWAPM